MYIVAVAWIYVVLLMALTEETFVAGLATFFFYGLGPLALLLYLMGTPQRRRNRRKREASATVVDERLLESASADVRQQKPVSDEASLPEK